MHGSRFFFWILLTALFLAFAGCAMKTHTSDDQPGDILSDNSESHQLKSSPQFDDNAVVCSEFNMFDDDLTMELYRKVLQNQTPLYFDCSDGDESLYLKDYYIDSYNPVEFPSDIEFAIVDMDDDGIPEVVLNQRGPDVRLVLYIWTGRVYGCEFGIKALGQIKEDGSFDWGYATNFGLGKLRIAEKKCEIIRLAEFEDCSLSSAGKYTIGDAEVSEDVFLKILDTQDNKKSVTWYNLADYCSK